MVLKTDFDVELEALGGADPLRHDRVFTALDTFLAVSFRRYKAVILDETEVDAHQAEALSELLRDDSRELKRIAAHALERSVTPTSLLRLWVKNFVAQRLRRRVWPNDDFPLPIDPERVPATHHEFPDNERVAWLHEAIGRLEPKARTVIEKRLAGYSLRDIADSLDLRLTDVDGVYAQTLNRLRREFDDSRDESAVLFEGLSDALLESATLNQNLDRVASSLRAFSAWAKMAFEGVRE